ncbi:hypothetical protein FV139_17560 [Parahaliea maris]|uniref:Lipoprotein n=1 Tax=Parahaliea maris TaxID=2716870 RepID=A0A5C8ZQL7_9GAMM|nr:hypothetical protein [Parahaliea maris]TXS90783.1 hypothetical protein FV139_17560 [Parahaliea maris]
MHRLMPFPVVLSLALQGCMHEIWNAGDLADWVRQQAVKEGCKSDSIELEDWYRKTESGNVWHGTCRNGASETMAFTVNVDPVWKPSES